MKIQRGQLAVPVQSAPAPAAAPRSKPAAPLEVEAPAAKPPLTLSAPEGKPVAQAGGLGWQVDGTWLDQTMMKPPFQTNLGMDDVEGGPPAPGVELPLLLPEDGREQVFAKLGELPLARLLVAPGYRYYRHPEAFPEVLAQVQANNRVDTRPSIIDIHTDGKGRVLSADLRSHHLRMAAFLESGRGKLSDLPFDQVLIKIDGVQRNDQVWKMRAHGYALPAEVIAKHGVHVVEDPVDPATVELDNLNNYELGSRTTMGRFHQTLLHREQPKVGVVFGDGLELLDRAVKLREARGLDEVVLAPSGPVTEALRDAVRKTEGVNLYLDEPAPLRETFPQFDYATLVKYRMNLVYGVDMHGVVTE